MKVIYCKITDGDNITAVSSYKKMISRIMEKENVSEKKAIKMYNNGQTDWIEVHLQ